MASRFSNRTTIRKNGMDKTEWVDRFIKDCDSDGVEQIKTINIEGKQEETLRKKCFVLFENPEVRINETLNDNNFSAPSVIGKAVDFVSTEDGILAVYDIKAHPSIKKRSMLVPIYDYNHNTSKYLNVANQCGAQWVGAGDPFEKEYHCHNVAMMYIYSLQSLIWQIANVGDTDDLKKYTEMTYWIVKSAKSYFATDQGKEAFKIIEPLSDCENANDMLNRAVAHIFFDNLINRQDMLRMVELSLKRVAKHRENVTDDFVTKPIYGITAMIITVPIFKNMVDNNINAEEIVSTINSKRFDLVMMIADNIEKKGIILDKMILHKLFELSGEKISYANIEKLYDFCMCKDNFTIQAPFEDWGLVKKIILPFEISVDGLFINGKKLVQKTKITPLNETENQEWRIISTNVSEWSCFTIKTPGTYIFSAKTVGAANLGNMYAKGVSTHNVASMCFLFGNDCMSKDQTIFSSGGIIYNKNKHQSNGRYQLEYDCKTFDPTKPFKLVINDSGSFTVEQNNKTMYNQQQVNYENPVLVSYKFLDIKMSYEKNKLLYRLERKNIYGNSVIVDMNSTNSICNSFAKKINTSLINDIDQNLSWRKKVM